MEHHGAKIAICFTIAVWSIFLLKDSQSYQSAGSDEKWSAPPSMDAFENYEAMQKYISEKESRDSRKLENPLDDSYIDAYNFHHESPLNFRRRRGTAEAIQGPKIFKFGIEDAKEPDEATKELIRMHRSRELRLEESAKLKQQTSRRKKRSPQKTEPKLIRFEVSDAREPDEATKELIRRSRAREMRMTTERVVPTTARPAAEPKRKVTRKRKRTRRSAQMTQPQFIRFEIADAKEPDLNMREMMREREMRSSSMNQIQQRASNETQGADDSAVEESKRIFFYHAVPVKAKRIANAVPSEVRKIIDLMLKDSKAQAYYKYIPASQDAKLKVLEKLRPFYGGAVAPVHSAPAENLVSVYPEQAYVQKLIPVPVQVPVHTFPVNVLSPPPHQQPTAPAPPPVVAPELVNNQQYYHHPASAPQSGPGAYQQPTTYLKVIPAMTQVFHEIPTSPAVQQPQQQHYQPEPSQNSIVSNEIPKPYPYAKIHPIEPLYRYGKRLNFYPTAGSQQTILPNDHSVGGGGGVGAGSGEGGGGHVAGLNIENQQQLVSTNSINKEQQQQQQEQQQQQQHQIPLKDMQEFQELSALIGKSPTDQIHGLAYLLAKEMQRSKRLKAQRPQDNTSPILFHPERHVGVAGAVDASQKPEESKIPNNQGNALPQPTLPPPLPQVYTPPVVEHSGPPVVAHVSQVHITPTEVVPPPPPPPPATSYNVVKTLGLSPNYKGIDQFDEAPALQADVEDGLGLQYASKYAFGYRVRDFYSGNDFGHKQNRDLDGVTRGQYHILLPDGRVQNVIYHADDTGFHADVSFETGHH